MNIFATYYSPEKSAIALDDKRVVKMTLESAQMLSTSLWFYGKQSPYLPVHINHPCTIWTRTSRTNYEWLLEHFYYLFKEYTYRYGKHHKCEELYEQFKSSKKCIPKGDFTLFADCAVGLDGFDDILEITKRYRYCMVVKWMNDKRKPEWKKRKKPHWYYPIMKEILVR